MPLKQLITSHLPELDIASDQIEKLELYAAMLREWQHKINLISPSTIDDIESRHIIDSLQLVGMLSDTDISIMDIGSGAGFPGLVLAIMGYDITCVESDRKKCIFLEEVSRKTNCNAKIACDRIENIDGGSYDVITARALAALPKLLDYVSRFVSRETICIFPKGENYVMELDQATSHWSFSVTEHTSVINPTSKILALTHIEKRDL